MKKKIMIPLMGLAVVVMVGCNTDKRVTPTNYTSHSSTNSSGMNNKASLERQCKQYLNARISREDQPLKTLRLDTATVKGKSLIGEGGVLFRKGGGSDISYACKFNPQGYIYDGYYKFH